MIASVQGLAWDWRMQWTVRQWKNGIATTLSFDHLLHVRMQHARMQHARVHTALKCGWMRRVCQFVLFPDPFQHDIKVSIRLNVLMFLWKLNFFDSYKIIFKFIMTDTNLESILFDNGNFIWYILLNFIYDKVYDSFLKLYSYYQIKFYLI